VKKNVTTAINMSMNELTAPVKEFVQSDINSLPDNKRICFRICPADLKTAKRARVKQIQKRYSHIILPGSRFFSLRARFRQKRDKTATNMEPARSTIDMGNEEIIIPASFLKHQALKHPALEHPEGFLLKGSLNHNIER
jgi:hypothetical protein